ncbi:hypothetical protein [Pseudomonas chlororaphis]|uniref:hypothetical protein n=1 Tax=Pseudomonas chlororaphis TaxID=587753 RepID=UPI00240850FA|nr:hypothetical protein [Pseudomonas chlororaphis]
MTTYARVSDGVFVEIIRQANDLDGNEIPIEERFHPEFVATLVAVDDAQAESMIGQKFDWISTGSD